MRWDAVSTGLRGVSQAVSELEFSGGIALVVAVSSALSIASGYLQLSPQLLSLDSNLLLSLHVHKLITYSFYHKGLGHLVICVGVLVFFCSGLEKGVGTVRFLHQLLLLSTCVGLLHVPLELLLFSPTSRSSVSGLIPVSLAVLGMVTISSRMRKALLMGVNVPTATVPWLLLLLITLFIPNTVLLCNVMAVVVGEMYGMGWFSLLEMSESKACVLEKKMPFRLLKKIPCVQFVPASAEERKKTLHAVCNPPPGSYPVQAYAPAPMSPPQAPGSLPSSLDGWPYAACAQQNYTVPSPYSGYGIGHSVGSSHGHSHGGHACGHSHGHSHQHQTSSSWTPVASHAHSHFSPPVNMDAQSFVNLPQVTVQSGSQSPHLQTLSQPAAAASVLPSGPTSYGH
ncbi:rhomboid domain-containing protein 2 [Astyanax mexicanus]|uniref:rhomboid domain-containing protein 2 n=1 Tax=Astyanax mexicanus TaxID=7994 RepID=UPI0020CAF369|nr:rhomboid domain-containing protein 2 [Astyanax mexicanus]